MGVEKVASSALWSPLHPSVLFRWHEQSIGKSYQTSSPTRGYALKHVKAFHPLLDSQIPHMATNEGYVLLGCGVIATPFRFLQCGYVFRHSTCQLILIMTDVKKLHNTSHNVAIFICLLETLSTTKFKDYRHSFKNRRVCFNKIRINNIRDGPRSYTDFLFYFHSVIEAES